MTNRTPWFNFRAAADDATIADIHIVDFIGDWYDEMWRSYGMASGVTAKAFIEELAALSPDVKTIRVHINSPGGDVFGALNIANALREQMSKGRSVETIVEGLAASAASIVMMAGQTVKVADNALVMIHNPWTIGIGEAADMRKTAETLDTIRGTIVATYRWHSSLDDAAIADLMDAETWMDADQALEHGFATDKIAGLPAAVVASLDRRGAVDRLAVPDQYRARVASFLKPAPAPAAQPMAAAALVKACRVAGCLELAEDLISNGATDDQVRVRVAEAQRKKADATLRADGIRAACKLANYPELADGYISGGMTVDAVRAQLTTITARAAEIEIDNSLPVDGKAKPKAAIDYADTYARMNAATSRH